jgi:Acetyltransferase (GNAT) domain
MQLVRHRTSDHADALPAVDGGFGLPFSDNGRSYYGAIAADTLTDYSFSFVDQQGPIATIACDLTVADRLTRFGSAIEIAMRDDINIADMRLLTSAVQSELRLIAKETGAKTATLRTTAQNDPQGIWSSSFLKASAHYVSAFRAVCDLSHDDDTLFADMRSHHRRQVRKGQGLLSLTAIDQGNANKDQFDSFRELHAEVAGRVTRPLASWNASFDLVAKGQGALVLAFIDDLLVGGTLVLDAGDTAYYASGAYRRDYFDKPISHYPLYSCFALARARGRRWFDVGDLKGEGATLDEKENHIAEFKAGFTSLLRPSTIWHLPLD